MTRKRVLFILLGLAVIAVGIVIFVNTYVMIYKGPKTYSYVETDLTTQRDGLSIVSTLAMPDTGEAKVPLVIVCHGYTGNRNGFEPVPYAKTFAVNGIASLRLDFTGNGESSGATTEMTISNLVKDVKAVFDMALTLDGIDPDRIFLLGCSQGGLVCSLAAAELGEQVKALILNYPALSIPDSARNGDFLGTSFDTESLPDTLTVFKYTIGACYLEDAMDIDVYSTIGAYTGDVLITHGDADTLIDIECSRRADEVYKNSELYIVAGGGHAFSWGKLRAVEQKEVEFVQQHG